MSIIPAGFQMPVSKFDDAAYEAVSATKYLPRVQLMGNNSGLVTSGDARPGEYALIRSKTDFNNLTKQWDGLVIAFRPKAMRIDKEGIVNIYDHASKEFKAIAADAEMSGAFERGTSFGPEFLVWVPRFKTLATFFCNSKTSRKSASALKVILAEFNDPAKRKVPAVTFKSSIKEGQGGKFKWPGPDFYECSSPVTPMPEWESEKFNEAVNQFLNPPSTEKEAVTEEEKAARTM